MGNAELEKASGLQDIEAIKRLKAEYCDICDDAHNPDRIGAIFAEDGIGKEKGSCWRRARGHSEAGQSFAERISFPPRHVFIPRRR